MKRNMVISSALAPLVAAAFLPTSSAQAASELSPVATWEMNEAAGASVMLDTSGNGLNGTIGNVVKTGMRVQGSIGYRFPFTLPNKTPAETPRRVLVNSSALNPGDRDFSITIRYRTTHGFGNIMQKGQAGAAGGYWKLEAPRGELTCQFRGRVDGKLVVRKVKSGMPLNDGDWHDVTCIRTAKRVSMTIDGSITRSVSGRTGNISNNVPMTIGGKVNCNQVTVTCDFFSGDIDRVAIKAG